MKDITIEKLLKDNRINASTNFITEEQANKFIEKLNSLSITEYFLFNTKLLAEYSHNHKIYTTTICGAYDDHDDSCSIKGKISRIGLLTENDIIIGTISSNNINNINDDEITYLPFLSVDSKREINSSNPVSIFGLSFTDKFFNKSNGKVVSGSPNSVIISSPKTITVKTDYSVVVTETYDKNGNVKKSISVNGYDVKNLNKIFKIDSQTEKE